MPPASGKGVRRAAPIAALVAVVCAAIVLAACHAAAAQSDIGELPADVPWASSTGRWEFVPIPVPDRPLSKILISRDQTRLWLGTPGGVAVYDGLQTTPPRFEPASDATSIIVNAMIELDDGSVLVGTINDSLWHWTGDVIRKIFDGETRNEWALARGEDGRVFVSTSFGRRLDRAAVDSIKRVAGDRVIEVAGGYPSLASVGDLIVAISQYGSFEVFEQRSMARAGNGALPLSGRNFVRSVHAGTKTVAIATDAGCLLLDPRNLSFRTVVSGNCTAAFVQGDGTTWASREGTYRADRLGWRRWSARGGELGAASTFAEDRLGNVWVGGSTGLWRYLDIVREVAPPGATAASIPSAIIADGHGGIIAGYTDGSAWKISSDLQVQRLPIPAEAGESQPPLSKGALPARDRAGALWILNHRGLHRMENGEARLVAPPPVPSGERSRTAASLAVWDEDNIYVGLYWASTVLKLERGNWTNVAELPGNTNATAVPHVSFDSEGALWAVGSASVLRIKGGDIQTFGPFDRAPLGKLHLFGALAEAPNRKGFVASSGWGGVAFLLRDGNTFRAVTRMGNFDQPYLIRSMVRHPELGLLGASETGLYRWQGSEETGSWKSLRTIEPRLDMPIVAVAPGIGRSFWIVTADKLLRVELPSESPNIELRRTPSVDPVPQRSVDFELFTRGLVGIPAARKIEVDVEPKVPGFPARFDGPVARFVLPDLSDSMAYRVTARAVDQFENASEARPVAFRVALPFYQNPLKASGVAVGALALLVLFVTRRGPMGFVLRHLARMRWSLERADPTLRLTIATQADDTVRFDMAAPAQHSTTQISLDLPANNLRPIARNGLRELASLRHYFSGENLRSEFEWRLRTLGEKIFSEAMPDGVRLAFLPTSQGSVQFILDDDLLNVPWEVAARLENSTFGLAYAMARVVATERLAAKDDQIHERLRLTVLAPQTDASLAQLKHTRREVDSVSRRAKAWGAKVRLLPPDSTKQDVLNALTTSHFFHYAGHAQFEGSDSANSYLPLATDRIYARDIHQVLSAQRNPLLLAFVNGCGSSREGDWRRGEAVFGLASAFLANATFFIGAQWPVQDRFAAQFADVFYRNLFPETSTVWWRWLMREELDGPSFAEALRRARWQLREQEPQAVPTWQAYVYYGDATCRLVLR
jgi:ligand-binding sensor domain-containing protein